MGSCHQHRGRTWHTKRGHCCGVLTPVARPDAAGWRQGWWVEQSPSAIPSVGAVHRRRGLGVRRVVFLAVLLPLVLEHLPVAREQPARPGSIRNVRECPARAIMRQIRHCPHLARCQRTRVLSVLHPRPRDTFTSSDTSLHERMLSEGLSTDASPCLHQRVLEPQLGTLRRRRNGRHQGLFNLPGDPTTILGAWDRGCSAGTMACGNA